MNIVKSNESYTLNGCIVGYANLKEALIRKKKKKKIGLGEFSISESKERVRQKLYIINPLQLESSMWPQGDHQEGVHLAYQLHIRNYCLQIRKPQKFVSTF